MRPETLSTRVIDTKYGDLPERVLQRRVSVQDAPCGTVVTTSWWDQFGELVKQDQHAVVTKGFTLKGAVS